MSRIDTRLFFVRTRLPLAEYRGANTLAGVIREAVSFAYANIRNKFAGELAKQNGAECGMRRVDVVW